MALGLLLFLDVSKTYLIDIEVCGVAGAENSFYKVFYAKGDVYRSCFGGVEEQVALDPGVAKAFGGFIHICVGLFKFFMKVLQCGQGKVWNVGLVARFLAEQCNKGSEVVEHAVEALL